MYTTTLLSFWLHGADTAEIYSAPMSEETVGKSEEILGTWLKRQQRDKVIVATKVSKMERLS